MNTKKFIAADMRQALKLVRDELGADAVILSNRKVPKGIEIIAAEDYEQFLETHSLREKKRQHVPECMEVTSTPMQQGDPDRLLKQRNEGMPYSHAEKARLLAALTRTEGAQEQLADEANLTSSVASLSQTDRVQNVSAAEPGQKGAERHWQTQSGAEIKAMRGELSQMRQLLRVQMENVAWGNFTHHQPLQASIFKRLSRLGLSPALARKLVRNVQPDGETKTAWNAVLKELSDDLPLIEEDVMSHGGIFAFVGPAGVGKTTTIAKIATQFVLEHGAENLALITTDSYRIAGHEQLNTLGRILKVPVRVVTEQQSLEHILRGLSRKQLILIDTAGLSHKDQVHTEQMEMLKDLGSNVQRWLVLSSTSQRRILDKAVNEYKHLNLEGCILTKLDESASLGEALSVAIESQLPIAYITDGQNIPDDFENPTASRLVNHAIALARDYQMDDAVVADMYNDAMLNAELNAELALG